ncbi:MAG: sulfotransferase domain-containing protein, partial [Ferrovibrio sp.]
EHPPNFRPEIPALPRFSRPADKRFSRQPLGRDWYLSQFPDDRVYAAWGEATPDYMFYPYVARDLHAFSPALKLIFLLRDPVERAYSAYWMWRRHTPDLPSFERIVEQYPDFIARGQYHAQISRFLEVFPRKQLYIGIYERVTARPEPFFRDLYEFLGVSDGHVPSAARTPVGGTIAIGGVGGYILYKIISPMINLPFVLPMWRAIRTTGLRQAGIRLLGGKSSADRAAAYEPLPASARERLLPLFREDMRKLADLLEDEIPEWNR